MAFDLTQSILPDSVSNQFPYLTTLKWAILFKLMVLYVLKAFQLLPPEMLSRQSFLLFFACRDFTVPSQHLKCHLLCEAFSGPHSKTELLLPLDSYDSSFNLHHSSKQREFK